MISFGISAVPPASGWAGLNPRSSRSSRTAADWCSRRSRRAPSGQRGPRRSPAAIWAANTRQGIVWPRRSSPIRGVAPMTIPNQRPRMSQPPVPTSTPVGSARHNCHRSAGCTMPATAARCGRAPASRRAAIPTTPGVRTLTTPAWARAALDDHRGRGAAEGVPCDGHRAGTSSAGDGQRAPEMPHLTLTVPGMNNPPEGTTSRTSRHG
jgi:hypothetical protein